jgi:hypothetical protein
MSTSNVTFQLGEAASASKLMGAFNVLRNQGQQLLTTLGTYRTDSLVSFEQRVEALNSRRERANRVKSSYVAVRFVATDLLDMDQTQTSATVRADTQAVTLQERQTATNAIVQQQTFSTSDGTAESISVDNSMYMVSTSDGLIPTGTFTLKLLQALNLTVLTFDLSAVPAKSTVVVSASPDGINYTAAVQTSMNGYRLTAWFSPMNMRYITLAVTPSAPDVLGGSSYTFGLTDFVGAETEFQLLSDLVTLPIAFRPVGTRLQLVAQHDPNLTFFLNFNNVGWLEYAAGATITIPGTIETKTPAVALHTGGALEIVLPVDAYPNSVQVFDETTSKNLTVVPNLSATDPNLAHLVHDYIALNGTTLTYIGPDLAAAAGHTFTVTFVEGPALVEVQLKVQLITPDRTVTPTFTGASLQEL